MKVSVANSVATFTDIPIYEGSQIVTNTVVNTGTSQRFIIDNSGVDISTLNIRVFQAANSSIFKDYKQANNILDIGASDEVYFVSEIEDEKYEIFFGDGVFFFFTTGAFFTCCCARGDGGCCCCGGGTKRRCGSGGIKLSLFNRFTFVSSIVCVYVCACFFLYSYYIYQICITLSLLHYLIMHLYKQYI